MTGPTVVAVITVLGSLFVAMLGTSWLNRKNLARLTKAQAGNTEATTFEISDRIARGWIADLDKKLTETNERLDDEARVRRGAIAYIERLLDWLQDKEIDTADLPALPHDLKAYIATPQ